MEPSQLKHMMRFLASLRKGVQTGESRGLWVHQYQEISVAHRSLFLKQQRWIGDFWELELGMIRKACSLSAYLCEKGLRTREGQQGYIRKFGNPASLAHTHTHTLGFSWLSGTLVASADAWWSILDTNIISPPQFAYHELKLYLRISLIQERTFPLLSWDTVAVGSPLTRLIPTGVTSYIY